MSNNEPKNTRHDFTQIVNLGGVRFEMKMNVIRFILRSM